MPADHARVERRAQLVLRKHDALDLALRGRVVLLDGGNPRVGFDDLRVAERDLLGRLRVFGRLLRHGSAHRKRLPPRVDVLLLLVGDFGALALGLDLGEVRGRLALRRFAFLQLGALRVVIELRQQRAGLHEVALVGLDGDDLAGDLETDLGNDLRLDGADPEDANLDILLRAPRPARGSRAQSANNKPAGNENEGGQRNRRFEQARHQTRALRRAGRQVKHRIKGAKGKSCGQKRYDADPANPIPTARREAKWDRISDQHKADREPSYTIDRAHVGRHAVSIIV